MFDPTVFDNVKVVLEGAVYDLDLAGRIRIANREDSIDLSSMSRRYSIRFTGTQDGADWLFAEIRLFAELRDLAAEILETNEPLPGCSLDVYFEETFDEEASVDEMCQRTEAVLTNIWGTRFAVRQTVSYSYGLQPAVCTHRTALDFGRKFGEGVIKDVPELLEHVLLSLERLSS